MGKSDWWNEHRGRWYCNPAAIVAMVIGGIALAACMAFLFGWLVMLLWNWLMPAIFGLPAITYWQAWGLLLLSHILVKGGWGHGGPGPRGRGKRHHRGPCGRPWDDEAKADVASRVAGEDGAPGGENR